MKCKCENRKALFITLNRNNLYACEKCGRMHSSRNRVRQSIDWRGLGAVLLGSSIIVCLLLVVSLLGG